MKERLVAQSSRHFVCLHIRITNHSIFHVLPETYRCRCTKVFRGRKKPVGDVARTAADQYRFALSDGTIPINCFLSVHQAAYDNIKYARFPPYTAPPVRLLSIASVLLDQEVPNGRFGLVRTVGRIRDELSNNNGFISSPNGCGGKAASVDGNWGNYCHIERCGGIIWDILLSVATP